MELDAIDGLRIVRNGRILRVPRCGNGVESIGQLGQLVAVRHPHLHAAFQALEQTVDVCIDALGRQLGRTVLPVDAGNNIVAVDSVGELLLAVANAQNGDLEAEKGRVDMRRVGVVDGVGAAAEDDAYGLEFELRQLRGAGEHLGVDIELAKTADDAAVRDLSVTHVGDQEGKSSASVGWRS